MRIENAHQRKRRVSGEIDNFNVNLCLRFDCQHRDLKCIDCIMFDKYAQRADFYKD
jgi:hypothetical protein